jgi:hypothetical protein
MTAGDISMDLRSPGADSLDPTIAAIAYRVVPTPSTLVIVGAGGVLMRRRRSL